jgi:mannose-6-phosphate isomerase-like protein (cupin superfamily)
MRDEKLKGNQQNGVNNSKAPVVAGQQDERANKALDSMSDKFSASDTRPWGSWESFELKAKPAIVKLLYIKKGQSLSYQFHEHRSEYWKVASGEVEAIINDKKTLLKIGDTAKVPVGDRHRMTALSDAIILEISFGRYDENDITRLKDEYGRA